MHKLLSSCTHIIPIFIVSRCEGSSSAHIAVVENIVGSNPFYLSTSFFDLPAGAPVTKCYYALF